MPSAPRLEVVLTRLEMRKPPKRRQLPSPPGKLALLRAEKPTVSFYRYLYNTIGERCFWWERRGTTDNRLKGEIQNRSTEIYVLYVNGVPAGFSELDMRDIGTTGDCELARFGLVPEFVHRGYGRYLLTWTVDAAWRQEPARIVGTVRSLDGPRAAGLLQWAGFVPYAQEKAVIKDPRHTGLIPSDTALPSDHAEPVGRTRIGAPASVTPLPHRG